MLKRNQNAANKKTYVQLLYMKQEKEMLEIKNKTTVQWLPQTGALFLLQPIQRAVTRLETEQSSHVLIIKMSSTVGSSKLQNDYSND